MFNKKSIFIFFIFICFQSANVSSFENRSYQQNFTQCKSYNSYIEDILNHLYGKFDVLDNSKNRQQILQLLVQIRLKELEHPDKYQFVTAQDSRYFAYQVIAKELYAALNGENIPNFEFLRYPSHALIKDPEEFFRKYSFLKNRSARTNPDWCDALPEISFQLLSASLSADTYITADSCLFVFLYGKGIAEWSNAKEDHPYHEKFLQNVSAIFNSAGIQRRIYQPYLRQLVEAAPRTNEGIINQIFLPIENIEKYLYISSCGGFLNSEKNVNIHQTIAEFQKIRFNNFRLKENMQVRLIIGSLFSKDVYIYRHTLIPEREQEIYRKHVRQIIQQMLLRQ